MSQATSPGEAAERLSRRRARMLPVLALFVLIQQAAFFSAGDRMRTVDIVRTCGWLVLVAVIVAALVTGGFWFRSREIRDLMDDEVTRANRSSALTLGFPVAMATGIVLYGLEAFQPGSVTPREAIHLIVSFGLVAALLRFGYLERRALG
ncbi:MAG: hypothetical protein ABIT16_08830 [Croceibacterium sp.]